MSWSISIPNNTPRDQVDAAVDAIDANAVTQGSSPTVGLPEVVEAAKAAIKALAKQTKLANVSASASGHCAQPGEESWCHDGISVQVYGSNPVA